MSGEGVRDFSMAVWRWLATGGVNRRCVALLGGVLFFGGGWFPLVAADDRVFAIDVGHGGDRPSGDMASRTLSSPNNAKSAAGVLEKTLTLEFSRALAEALQREGNRMGQGVVVRLTRSGDENPDFAERVKRCSGKGPAPEVVVSIHFNASSTHRARGTVAMIAAADHNPSFDRDRALAVRISRAASRGVQKFLPDSSALAPITDSHLHGGKGSNLFYQLQKHPVLRKVPACFLEVEFLDRPDVDERLLKRRAEAFPVIAGEIARELLRREE